MYAPIVKLVATWVLFNSSEDPVATTFPFVIVTAVAELAFPLTYNLEFENLAKFPENTILVHRKKDFNVLYTINALNFLVKQITGGFANNKVEVDWRPYRNSLLLTEEGIFKQIRTKLFNIKNLES